MRLLLKIGFGLLLLSLVLIGLAFAVLRTQGVNNRNQTAGRELASETRPVSDAITQVKLDGAIDMTLRQGAVPSLTVRGEERLLGNIDTVRDGNSLQISVKGMLLHKRLPLQVVLVLPFVDTVRVRGSGDSTVNGFSGDQVDVQLDGSGSVKFNGRFKAVKAHMRGTGDMEMNGGASERVEVALAGSGEMTVVGSCKELKANLAGSGEMDAQHLAAEVALVELSGSGSSVVQATRRIEATVHGSGKVSVTGNPTQRVVSRTGSGVVSFNE